MNTFAHAWWVVTLHAVFGLLFGLVALFMPGVTLISLVYLFGAYAIIHGIVMLASLAEPHSMTPRWVRIAQGVLGLGIGLLTFVWPGVTMLTLLVLVAVWAIVDGIMRVVSAIELHKVIEHEWLLALSGVLSMLFGAAILIWPILGALALVTAIGIYAIINSALLLWQSIRLRNLAVARRAHP
jgi:uncharacterized membrane protein HdeD (DUF308 family)